MVRGPKGGLWYWRAEYREGGRVRTVWTGWGDVATIDREVAAIVARDGLDEPRQEDKADMVGELLGYWWGQQKRRADISERTRSNCDLAARRLKRDLGNHRLDRLDRVALEDHRDRRLRSGDAPATIALDLRTLRQAWRYGRAVGLAPPWDLPTIHIRMEPRRNSRTPTEADVAAIVAKLDGWQRLAVVLLYATGCRLGEIATLEWEDVDFEAAEIRVCGKTGARVVPLHAQVVAMLRGAPRVGSRVLGVETATIRKVGSWITRAATLAETPTFSPHGLRRLVCDRLYRSGVDVGTAAAILGHSPEIALKHYRRAVTSDLRRAVDLARLGILPSGDVIPIGRGRT